MAKKYASAKSEDWNLDSGSDLTAESSLQKLIELRPYKLSKAKEDNAPLSIRVGRDIYRWISDIKEKSYPTPYRINSDVARDALYLGLIVLNVRTQVDPRWKAEAVQTKVTMRARHERERLDEVIHFAQDLVRSYNNSNSKASVVEDLCEYLKAAGNSSTKEKHWGTIRGQLLSNNGEGLLNDTIKKCQEEDISLIS